MFPGVSVSCPILHTRSTGYTFHMDRYRPLRGIALPLGQRNSVLPFTYIYSALEDEMKKKKMTASSSDANHSFSPSMCFDTAKANIRTLMQRSLYGADASSRSDLYLIWRDEHSACLLCCWAYNQPHLLSFKALTAESNNPHIWTYTLGTAHYGSLMNHGFTEKLDSNVWICM